MFKKLKSFWQAKKQHRIILSVMVTLLLVGASAIGLHQFALSSKSNVASATTGPNIIFILTDDQAIHSLKHMPYLMSRPGGRWIDFTNAFVNVSMCCPSRASILSGQYSHHTGVNANGKASTFRDASTLATWLQSEGYETTLIGKYLNKYPWDKGEVYIPPGWDNWYSFTAGNIYYDYTLNQNGTLVRYGSRDQDYSTDVFKNFALNSIDQATSESKPFFIYLSTSASHSSWNAARRHKGVYANLPIEHSPNFNEADVSDKPRWVRNLGLFSSSKINTTNANIRKAAETLLSVDEAVEAIMDKLSEKGVLDNTILIFMGDNGYSFGSHRWMEKGCEFEECIKVPLLVRYPFDTSIGGARTETRMVQNVDIAPTIAELAGVTVQGPVDGMSFVRLLNNEVVNWRTSLLLRSPDGAPGKFWGVRTTEWKYIELSTGEKELYSMVNDPYELTNIANQSQHAAIQASLAAELARLKSLTPQ